MSNVTIPATGTGDVTPVIATDDVGGIHLQRIKLDGGAAGLSVPIVAGPQLAAVSVPVVLATDQPAIPIVAPGSLPLPTGAATEATLASLNAKVVTVNTGAVAVASSALPTGASTEATLSALNTKVTAVNTGAVVVASSALPTGAATEATLASLNGKVTAVNTGAVTVAASALPTGAATEATLSALNAKVTTCNTGAVVISGALPAGTANIGDVDIVTMPGVVGTVADDATTPGAPVMVGGHAKSPDGTDPGNVSAEDDVARVTTDLNRRLYVNPRHARSLHAHLDGASAYTDQSVVAAPGSGLQTVITNIIGSTGAATALNFFLEEGSTKIFGPIYLEAVAGRGFCSGPIYLPITPNTAVTLTSSAAIAQSFDFDYFIQKV